MKIKTTLNTEIQGKKTPSDKKKARRKPATNQKPRLSLRIRISAAFRLMGRVLASAFMTVLILMAVYFAFNSNTFLLRDISISGCRHQDAGYLEYIIRDEFPANILRIDLDKARRRLEKETWVKNIEIHRVLPSQLVMRVNEREPAVLLELGGVQMMADTEGVLLGAYKREFGKIESPIFKGFDGVTQDAYIKNYEENAERIHRGISMLAEIAAEMPLAVREISEIDISEWNNLKIMMNDDPVEIFMGGGNYVKRFAGFIGDPTKKYQELKNQGVQVAQIDLSNDGQIVYKSIEAVAREKALKNRGSGNR